jgi:hypothetical protein
MSVSILTALIFAESVLTLLASLTLAVVLGYFALGKLIVLLLYIKPIYKFHLKWLILPIGFGMYSKVRLVKLTVPRYIQIV